MSRDLTTEEKDEMAASLNRPAVFYEGVFDTTTLRLWSGIGDKTFNSQTFLGNGWLQSIRTNAETNQIRASGITIELSGVTPTLVSVLLNESYHKGTGKLWLVMLDENEDIVGDGYLLFSGRLDRPEINESGEGALISIPYESILAALLRPREKRYTDQGQRFDYPDDSGLQYVVQSQNWSGYWGRGQNKLNLRRRHRYERNPR